MFHPTSRYPASHAINASSTSTTIWSNHFPQLSGCTADPIGLETKPLQTRAVHGVDDLGVGVAAADPAVNLEVGHGPRIEQRCELLTLGNRGAVEVHGRKDAIGEAFLYDLPAGVGVEGEDGNPVASLHIRLQFDLIHQEARDSGHEEGPTVEAPIADARQLGARLLSRDDDLFRLLDCEAGGVGALRCG